MTHEQIYETPQEELFLFCPSAKQFFNEYRGQDIPRAELRSLFSVNPDASEKGLIAQGVAPQPNAFNRMLGDRFKQWLKVKKINPKEILHKDRRYYLTHEQAVNLLLFIQKQECHKTPRYILNPNPEELLDEENPEKAAETRIYPPSSYEPRLNESDRIKYSIIPPCLPPSVRTVENK